MRWFSRLFGTKSDPLRAFLDVYGGREVSSGVRINWRTALDVTTVLRCCGVIADGIASVPLRLYRKDSATGRRAVADDHPLHDLLHTAPNEWQNSLEFRETIAFHIVLTGNAFVFVGRGGAGRARRITELLPIEPGLVQVSCGSDMRLSYRVTTKDGKQIDYPSETIWHIRGPAWNGWMGLEAVHMAREAIGLAAATERAHGMLFRNGVRTSGALAVDGNLTDDQYRRLRAYIDAQAVGLDNTGRPLILDRAAKWMSLAMTGVDAQHIETRRHQVEEICRAFGVMPLMVGYSDKTATFAAAEQMFLAHNVHTIRPWHRRLEASIKRTLLTPEERDAGYYPKFIDTELLRGAAKDRAEYYQKGISAGWLTRNEAREWEELDPIDGLSEPLAPLNMTVGNPPPPASNEV